MLRRCVRLRLSAAVMGRDAVSPLARLNQILTTEHRNACNMAVNFMIVSYTLCDKYLDDRDRRRYQQTDAADGFECHSTNNLTRFLHQWSEIQPFVELMMKTL